MSGACSSALSPLPRVGIRAREQEGFRVFNLAGAEGNHIEVRSMHHTTVESNEFNPQPRQLR